MHIVEKVLNNGEFSINRKLIEKYLLSEGVEKTTPSFFTKNDEYTTSPEKGGCSNDEFMYKFVPVQKRASMKFV